MQTGWSSLGYSIAANLPNYPPPQATNLQSNNIRGSSPFHTQNNLQFTPAGINAPVVSKRSRTWGMRFLYSYGAQISSWFREIATGQVESSKFQPAMTHQYYAAFNDALYQAGYPQNLGLSFKVSAMPEEIRTSAAWGRMSARPNYTRNVFTNRSFGIAPSVPAIPMNGRKS